MERSLITERPDAVVVHCSDYRFQTVIRDFLQQGLDIASYDLLALPGGPHFASTAMEIVVPKQQQVGKDSLRFLIEQHDITRVILVDHSDCAFFRERLAFFFSEPSPSQKQLAKLRTACDVLRDWFPKVTVEAYFAEAREDHLVRFTKVA
jgi:carbonic anhydrase